MNQNSPDNNQNATKAILLCASIFISIFSLAFVVQAASNQYQLGALLKAIIDQIFVTHYSNFNIFFSGKIEGILIIVAFEIMTLIALVITVLTFTFFLNVFTHKWRINALKVVTVCWITAFFVFIFLQQLKRNDAFAISQKQFSNRPLDKRIASIIGTPYLFANHCNKLLKKPINVDFLSDAKLSKDPYMTQQRGLSYYFYPNISIRIKKEGEVDGKLYFYKNNVLNEIPRDHSIVCRSNDMKFVLAVKTAKLNEYVNR